MISAFQLILGPFSSGWRDSSQEAPQSARSDMQNHLDDDENPIKASWGTAPYTVLYFFLQASP